jgi:hypothetical protein
LTFNKFQAQKEQDRSKFFKKKGPPSKKSKLVEDVDSEVKINIGLMTTKDGSLSTKRGLTLPLTVRQRIMAEELLEKAALIKM